MNKIKITTPQCGNPDPEILLNSEILRMKPTQQKIRTKLQELTEYTYSNGTVLFKIEHCTAEEITNIRNNGILDTIARILANTIEKTMPPSAPLDDKDHHLTEVLEEEDHVITAEQLTNATQAETTAWAHLVGKFHSENRNIKDPTYHLLITTIKYWAELNVNATNATQLTETYLQLQALIDHHKLKKYHPHIAHWTRALGTLREQQPETTKAKNHVDTRVAHEKAEQTEQGRQ